MAIVGEYGSAPDYQQQGYKGQGFVVHGTEEEVLSVFRTSDVVLVKGAPLSGTDGQHEFYPMFPSLGLVEFSNVVGGFITKTRTSAGLSAAELAERAQISESQQRLIESGLVRPDRQYMRFMASIFGSNFKEQLTEALCA